MFHFYGGIEDPTPYAWMQSMTDFEEIEESVKVGKYTSGEYRLNIDLFLDPEINLTQFSHPAFLRSTHFSYPLHGNRP